NPPRFHAEYQGHEAFIDIATGEVIHGHLPRTAARIVKEWCMNHQHELFDNWQRGQALQPMVRIPGADND
ncbi:MAG: DUF4160 domain-containing protein, partial [Gammaproteobacteria bacterium]